MTALLVLIVIVKQEKEKKIFYNSLHSGILRKEKSVIINKIFGF